MFIYSVDQSALLTGFRTDFTSSVWKNKTKPIPAFSQYKFADPLSVFYKSLSNWQMCGFKAFFQMVLTDFCQLVHVEVKKQ